MARADLVCDLIKYGLAHDDERFVQAAQAIGAEERDKRHTVLADRIEKLIEESDKESKNSTFDLASLLSSKTEAPSYFMEKEPVLRMDDLILPELVRTLCSDVVEEQVQADLLRSHGLEPRHKVLLVGPPGNGKTSLAEAVASSLELPFYIVRYDQLVDCFLGETAKRLGRVFDQVRKSPCVLFFDEFEAIGKERGDMHESGEIKRVVSSLLMQIDNLPSSVVAIAATNHDGMLDKAVWRRFQVRVELPRPTCADLTVWLDHFEHAHGFDFGMANEDIAQEVCGCSFAELEEIAFAVRRRLVLSKSSCEPRQITERVLRQWDQQRKQGSTEGIWSWC